MSSRSHQSALIIQRSFRQRRLSSQSSNNKLEDLSPHQHRHDSKSATVRAMDGGTGTNMPADILIQPQIGATGAHEFLDFTELSFDESYGNIIEYPPAGTTRNREQSELQLHLEDDDEDDDDDSDDDEDEAKDKVDGRTVFTFSLLSKAGTVAGATVVSRALSRMTSTSAMDDDDVASSSFYLKGALAGGGGGGGGGGGATGGAAVTSAAQASTVQ